jgi:hypothetical protein
MASRGTRGTRTSAKSQHERRKGKCQRPTPRRKRVASRRVKGVGQMRRQLGIAKANGAFSKEYKTEMEELHDDAGVVEGEDEKDKDVRESMKEVDDEFKEKMREPVARLRRNQAERDDVREKLKKKGWDEFLGPLWTEEIEGRYQNHCGKPIEANLDPLTRRRYLKYYVEKRLRRRAKWTQWRIRRKVKREQNRTLPEMVPVGTSFVFCARLNFHDFKLSRRIMKYFGFLALADYHDRIRMRCENVGAVLVNANEAYTTKKCPVCDKHVNVGAAKVFRCPKGHFERHRDIKVGAC